MEPYTVYFWWSELSPHATPLHQELLRSDRIAKSIFVAQNPLRNSRLQQGWQTPSLEKDGVIVTPSESDVVRIVETSPPDSVHVFAGTHWVPCIVTGIKAVIRHRRRFGIVSEPRVDEGLKGLARLAHSWLTEIPHRRHADFVLAIGEHGPAWFRKAGYGSRRIFPFAYFLPDRSAATPPRTEPSALPQVSFVGRLERLKGIHLFLDAVPRIRNQIRVRVAGTGSQTDTVTAAAKQYPRFDFDGPVPMDQVPTLLAETDILVLPSITKDDGWGAVVSEALMAGAAVVTSSCVGASMCLTDAGRGRVVSALDGAPVAAAVDSLIDTGVLGPESRAKRRDWAVGHLDQRAGARYFLSILDHLYQKQPRPPSFVTS